MNCIKLHTLEGVSDSSILSPSNTNRIAPCERPCVPSGYTSSKDKIKMTRLSFAVCCHQLFQWCILFNLEMYNTAILHPRYLVLQITHNKDARTCPVTFKLMCSLLPTSGLTSGWEERKQFRFVGYYNAKLPLV